MKTLSIVMVIASFTSALLLQFAVSSNVLAAGGANQACTVVQGSGAKSSFCQGQGENIGGGKFAQSVTNTLLFMLGIGAVIMIVIGGIKYASANGDASQVQSAKNTIMYSVVGLVVAIMAWGIVTFVITTFA